MTMSWSLARIVAAALGVRLVLAVGLADIDHVVLFMQENRAFDTYFGTMAGVRGFNDANLQTNGGVPVWNQLTTPDLTNETAYLTPWYLNYLGGNSSEATQCMVAGSNGWKENHAAWSHGTNDHWAMNNTPWSLGFYKEGDLPTQWALVDNYIVGDMYQESVVASTSPNRVFWTSGSINVPGGPQKPDQGGNPYIDNNETPGCQGGNFNCYPLKWKTAAEHYEEAGVSWQVFQDADNFDDNPFAWMKTFQDAKRGTSLHERGIKGLPINTFYEQAANGTLPQVSYIIGPPHLSEHAPYSPHDGAWLENKVAEAVIKSPKYSKTVLIIAFDETGGWFDHVDPYRSPKGTPGEWLDDPYGLVGYTFAGPGFRVPMYIISPFTRNGGVYTEHSDHNSQLLFIEKWQAAKGRNVTTDQMVRWRRDHMGDLVAAFDFCNPDYSVPDLPHAPEPHRNKKGDFDGAEHCSGLYPSPRPPVPYSGLGVETDIGGLAQHGFKPVRGRLTEGRYLVLEMNGYALSGPTASAGTGNLCLSRGTEKHENPTQRWVLHAVKLGGDEFTVSSAVDGRYIRGKGLCARPEGATVFTVAYTPSRGYSLQVKDGGLYLTATKRGQLTAQTDQSFWKVYSVNY